MNLVDYEKYYHSGSEFIIPRDEFEKIIEENQRLNNVLNEITKIIEFEWKHIINYENYKNHMWEVDGLIIKKNFK